VKKRVEANQQRFMTEVTLATGSNEKDAASRHLTPRAALPLLAVGLGILLAAIALAQSLCRNCRRARTETDSRSPAS
jgi:hypothetical protein